MPNVSLVKTERNTWPVLSPTPGNYTKMYKISAG